MFYGYYAKRISGNKTVYLSFHPNTDNSLFVKIISDRITPDATFTLSHEQVQNMAMWAHSMYEDDGLMPRTDTFDVMISQTIPGEDPNVFTHLRFPAKISFREGWFGIPCMDMTSDTIDTPKGWEELTFSLREAPFLTYCWDRLVRSRQYGIETVGSFVMYLRSLREECPTSDRPSHSA